MKDMSQIVDQIVDNGDLSDPDAIKVDVQVRTGGGILPPRWFMPLADSRDVGMSRKRATRASRTPGRAS